jgi:hypothetical protein
MKNLVLGSLIAVLASQAAGCIIETDDSTYVTASWSIKKIENNTIVPSCPPNITTAALYSQPVQPDGTMVGPAIVDLFDCNAFSGTSSGLAPGLYLNWIDLATDNNSSLYAKSLAPDFNDDGFPDNTDMTVDNSLHFDLYDDGGYFDVSWALQGAQTNTPLQCSTAGATGGVEITATLSGTSSAASDQFDCENGYGITGGYLAGSYTLSMAALNAADQSIGTAPTIPTATIGRANAVTHLNTITIPIDGK